MKQKRKYARSLAKYTEEPSSDSDSDDNSTAQASDASNFDPPPPPPRKKVKSAGKKKQKPTATVSKPPESDENNKENAEDNGQLIAIQPTNGDSIPSAPVPSNSQNLTTNNNYLAMLKQNPVGMFMGANLNNCTININIPK